MKKVICILLTLVVCLSMTLTVFAETEFVKSPGEGGFACKHGHTLVEGKKDSTCTQQGHTGNLVCKDCGEIVEAGKVIPKEEHKYVDGVCTVCGGNYQPTTGDHNMVMLWAMMLLSAAGLVAITMTYRKKV